LRESKDAVFGPQDLRNADGSLMATGFMSDMGRPPKCSVSDADASLGLHELWSNTLGRPLFALRRASIDTSNPIWLTAYKQTLVGGNWDKISPESDDAVFVPCGYRGPYLDLPQGETGLKDGWDSAIDPRPFVLLQAGTLAPFTLPSATVIGGVVSYGADGTKDTAPNENPYNTDLPLIQFIDDGSVANSMGSIQVTVLVKDGAVPSSSIVKLRLYGPDPESGFVAYYEVDSPPLTNSSGDQTFSFEFPLTSLVNGKPVCNVGARVLRAVINSKKSNILPVTISLNHPTTFNLTVQ